MEAFSPLGQDPKQRVVTYVKDLESEIYLRMDRWFRWLFLAQWVLGIVVAYVVSPYTWSGSIASIHTHLWTAIFLGGAIVSLPIYLTLAQPGAPSTRYCVAIAQMLYGAMLIHLMGGRLEAHFHVFGSLAFLSTYRQWKVLIPATIVVVLDHVIRGVFWPQSIYGVLTGAEWRWVEHSAWVVFEDIFLILAIVYGKKDISKIAEARVEMEEKNKELDKKRVEAEKANRAKSAFLANMSHELRTPMHGILSFARFGLDDAEAASAEEHRGNYKEIFDTASSLMVLLNDLLDQAKLESGKMKYNRDSYDISELADVVRSEFSKFADEKNVTLNMEESKGDMFACFDRDRLLQVLRNLVSNAIKFSNKDSVVTIKIMDKSGDGFLTVAIENYGVGIDPEELTAIFENFTQSQRTSNGSGGTGLGLAICKKIIHDHEGEIWADSDPDGRTVFTFTLPEKLPIPTVLVVDDDPSQLKLLTHMVQKNGFETADAKSGFEALEAMKSQKIHAVITDIEMPGMNGIELAKNCIENFPEMPLLFVSGRFDQIIVDTQDWKELREYDVLDKPVDREKLKKFLSVLAA